MRNSNRRELYNYTHCAYGKPSDDNIAPFSTDNYQKLLSKHPQQAKIAAPYPENLDSFFVTNFDLYKAIMSFPNGSAAGPDKIVPQIFKDLVIKSNGSAGLSFLKSLTKLINLIGDGKIPKPLRPFFFGAKLIAIIKLDSGLRPIAISNTLRRIASKCAGSKALSKRQSLFGNAQVGCGNKRGAEIATHSFRNQIERDDNPKDTVLLKLDFKNAFNSLNRETMRNHVYSNRPESYNYTYCAYGKTSDVNIAPFLTDNYQKLLSKHPQRAKFAAPYPEKLDSFFVTDFDLYKTIMSFPNGSAAGPDKIVPQNFKDLVSKSNGSAGLSFLKSLTKLTNLIGDGKIPEPLGLFFFGAKLIALIQIE